MGVVLGVGEAAGGAFEFLEEVVGGFLWARWFVVRWCGRRGFRWTSGGWR